MITRKGMGWRRVVTGLLAASMLLAILPGTASAAAWLDLTTTDDGSSWSWPALAQTIVPQSGGTLDSVTLKLHRKTTDTGSFRVEIRQYSGGVPTGSQYASTGVILASQTIAASGISTDSSAPDDVSVVFTYPAVLTSNAPLAVVLIRGTNTGLAWHASTPGGADEYAGGNGFFCVRTNCWDDGSPNGAVDFIATFSGSGGLIGAAKASVVAPRGPTRASTFTYTILFDKAVAGLAAGDFTKSGSADNCSLGAPVNAGGGTVWTMAVTGCTQGSLRLTLKANAVSVTGEPGIFGPAVATPSPAGLRIDRTKPVVGAPRATPTFGPVNAGEVPIKLTWDQGTDAGGAGVRLYEVGRSVNGGTSWTLLGTSQPELAVISAVASGSVIYRIRAVDWAGNKGAWKETPVLRPRIVQQTSANVTFSSGWTTLSGPTYSGGSARQSDASGAAARYTFTGRGIGVVMTTDPSLGVIKVYIDGVLKSTVDMATLFPGDQLVVYGRRFSSYGTHVIRIVSSSGARPNVILDGFVRL